MKKGDTLYITTKNLNGLLSVNFTHSVGLRTVHVTNVGKVYVEGFILEKFVNLPNNGRGHNIITKKKKKRGIEIDFEPNDSVAIGVRARINSSEFQTFEEAKLELIKFISNDFYEPDEY